MEVTLENKGEFERSLTVTIDAARVDELINQEVKQLSTTVNMPGFRPGKTPLGMLESRYREHIGGAVAEKLLQESYGKAMSDNKVNPAGQPKLDVGQVARGENFVYTATFEQIPEVKPETYKDFEISRTSAVVEESDC